VLFMSNYLLNSQGDRVMMGRSVEGRVPFLDHRVIELGARIPPKYKVNGTEEKYLLKRAFDDILPADISRRPKKPYRAPIAECLAPGTPSGAMLRGDSLTGSGLLNANGITKLLAKAESEGKVSERDEMALAVAASLQLLHLYFIRDFESHILKD